MSLFPSSYGKLGQISKSGSNIRFRYDAGGNRIVKEARRNQQYYIRDAQGNILSVYRYDGMNLTWAEQDIYGSSRLGAWSSDATVPAWSCYHKVKQTG